MQRRVGSLIGAALIIGATFLLAASPVAADDDDRRGTARVIRDGLSSPKGLALLTRNSLAIGQGAYGPPPAPALEYVFRGAHKGTVTPITDPVNIVDVAVTPDGAGWAIGGDGILYRQTSDGTISPILNLHAYQAADPDPHNVAPQDPAETNPFGLAALKSNDVLLADAAGNDIIRVKPDGTAWTVARWKTQLVRTDKVGDPTLPKRLPAEAVPTSIAIGKDGWAYVGQLVGFPGRPGSAHVWRVNPNAHDAVCDVTTQDQGVPGLEVRLHVDHRSRVRPAERDALRLPDRAWRLARIRSRLRAGWRLPEGGPARGAARQGAARAGEGQAVAAGRHRRRPRWGDLRDRRHVHGRTTASHPALGGGTAASRRSVSGS